MSRLRRVTALLSALLFFQFMLVGSGVLCDAGAMTHGAGRDQLAVHGVSMDVCPGMSSHGCGIPSAPAGATCGAMSSCVSPTAIAVTGTRGTPAIAHPGLPRQEFRAPPSWDVSPDFPPPRA